MAAEDDNTTHKKVPIPTIKGVILSDTERSSLEDEALMGSGEAAHRIFSHYFIGQGNRKEALYWARIAAENGNPVGQYNLGFLLRDDPDERNRKRAIYWLKKLAEQGDELSASLLEEIENERNREIDSP